jgi:DNA polymerase elongation subunit (family B)
MLREILDTRVMVKQGMKTSKGNKVCRKGTATTMREVVLNPFIAFVQSLLQVLNARQLGLKLMAVSLKVSMPQTSPN